MKKTNAKTKSITLTPYHERILSEMSAKTRITHSGIIRLALEKIYPVLMGEILTTTDHTNEPK